MDYTVHEPLNPDRQTMDRASVSQMVEEQYVLNSLYTGGFNRATQAHPKDRLIESEANHPQMAGAKGSSCQISGCDRKVMSDERGEDILPCKCGFKICRECYNAAITGGGGGCPGCGQPYKKTDLDETTDDDDMFDQLLVSVKPMAKSSARTSSLRDGNLGIAKDDEIATSKDKPWKPLTEKVKPPASVIGPYWYNLKS